MCSKNEYTKSESNSQLNPIYTACEDYCVQRTNIQNLKAIHNTNVILISKVELCSKNEYTKSESNSQLTCLFSRVDAYCVQRTNIQNLKAIHNPPPFLSLTIQIVFKERIYKIWKQFTTPCRASCTCRYCVQRTNIQNLKAIHNGSSDLLGKTAIVFKERIYKIWKQFTTIKQNGCCIVRLCSKNEYTKSESNSQRISRAIRRTIDCVQRTNIQNLKAIHNRRRPLMICIRLCSKNEYTKSESNSQQDQSLCQFFAHFSCLAFLTL